MEQVDLEGLLRNVEYSRPSRCSKCGSFLKYTGLGEYICEECGVREYDDYGKVRAFLEKNPGASVAQTEAVTGVPQRLIHQMVADGKFEIKPGHSYLKGGQQ